MGDIVCLPCRRGEHAHRDLLAEGEAHHLLPLPLGAAWQRALFDAPARAEGGRSLAMGSRLRALPSS